MNLPSDIPADMPVLIAGPTASGKSRLALELAERAGGAVINADALQVYANWSVLTARPGAQDLARAAHSLYGHVAPDQTYSVGHWLAEVAALLGRADTPRPIIVGGTGLYFRALTEGLAPIPPVPAEIRAEADRQRETCGHAALLAQLDPDTRARIDTANPMRVQRAWEVLRATGTGLAEWQDRTPPPLLPLGQVRAFVVSPPVAVLNARIAARADVMLSSGALEEARANLPGHDPRRPSSRAIGAPELIAHLRGEISLEAARAALVTATRQYAKRQRTWARARMRDWQWLSAEPSS